MQFSVLKIIELRRGIQMLQAKTSVGTTLVGPPCMSTGYLSVYLPLISNKYIQRRWRYEIAVIHTCR